MAVGSWSLCGGLLYKFCKMFVLLIAQPLRKLGKLGIKLYVYHIGWMTVVAPTDHLNSVGNRCVIEGVCSDFVLL